MVLGKLLTALHLDLQTTGGGLGKRETESVRKRQRDRLRETEPDILGLGTIECLLQQGHTSKSFPNSSTNFSPSI